ncbi:uncharacterized protein LOC105685263 isoform X1 [Athalia rosae]|uniref:uncharacterized protein LOC105685263 isoform X1 n=1 Tax=Athalia rosae TaxID=37344 RepID=UPI0020349955|nr:uncharacterized protein LOC105685263 isoform X1 [Athalia rosae]XP_048508976.1 uncharacterized protein LOC105685263 isoform X1 [Athalia rosae]XP_048508977.1 uncharacterized protein LOC105685263 isoform X1 [Athalia rosae]
MTIKQVETAGLENVITIHGNPIQKSPEVIDVNIKTNISVSNSKGSKFVQKLLFVIVLFLTSTFTLVILNVRKEFQTLKSQEQCIETKIALLMTKYEKVSNQLSRVRSHMNYNRYYQPLTTSQESGEDLVVTGSNLYKETFDKYNRLIIADLLALQNGKRSTLFGVEDRSDLGLESKKSLDKRNIFGRDHTSSSEMKNDTQNSAFEDNDEVIDLTKHNKSTGTNRFTRTIVSNATDEDDESPIQTVVQRFTDAEPNLNSSESKDINIDTENADSIDLWSEQRTTRIRRDNDRRGKIRTKKKRRPNRSRRRLGPLVATFIGGIPEQHITDTGAIGPWVKMTKNTSHFDLQKFHLVDNKRAIEITMNGLYMISVQIFYIGQYANYSYWILLNSEGHSTTQQVTKCSAVSSAAANEVSCHTNVVLPLRKGDRLHVQQQECDRWINLREGHSYVQLVLLSNESEKNRSL